MPDIQALVHQTAKNNIEPVNIQTTTSPIHEGRPADILTQKRRWDVRVIKCMPRAICTIPLRRYERLRCTTEGVFELK